MRFFSRNGERNATANIVACLIPIVAVLAIKRALGAQNNQLRIGATPSGKGVKIIPPLAMNRTCATYILDPKHSISNWHLGRDRSDT
jgi:hypothetical protein